MRAGAAADAVDRIVATLMSPAALEGALGGPARGEA
jgi:hypothetical protein